MIRTLIDTISNPAGTARLLEGYSTLNRAHEARLTYDQLCTVFPDAAKYSETELAAFRTIGMDLVQGASRFQGNVMPANHCNEPELA